MMRCTVVDCFVRGILMTIYHRNGTLHTVEKEQALVQQVFPRGRKSREDEVFSEVIVRVVGRALRWGLLNCPFNIRWCDSDKQQPDVPCWWLCLLADVAGNALVLAT